MSEENLPTITDEYLRASGLPSTMEMSPGLAIFFNDALYRRCKQIALHMANAEGMTPRHLLGKPEACFAVVSRAIVWKMDPFSVSMTTYQTPGGSIGYMGSLIQAILENSGRLDGGVTFKHEGDWSRVQNKFTIKESAKGGKYPVPTWTAEDAKGLYVVVSAKLKGELEPRTLPYYLVEAFPLNSPLWATAPSRQICYTAVRAFANLAVPSLLLGVPFDVDPTGLGDTNLQDITPAKPKRSEFERSVRDDPAYKDFTAKLNFAVTEEVVRTLHDEAIKVLAPDMHERWNEQCDTRLAQIRSLQTASDERNRQEEAERRESAEQSEPTEETATQAEPATSDHEWRHIWGDKLANATEVKDVADVRAAGLKELPEHLHAQWNEACDSRGKAVADKPRQNGKGKKAETKPAPEPVRDDSALGRGRRLLPKLDSLEDVADLHTTIRGELESEDQVPIWDAEVAERRKALGGT